MATLCSDLRFPWSGKPDRETALNDAVRRLDPKRLYPYDVATARSQLMIQGCLRWPAARVSTYPAARELLPRTLILHGSNDLFCPLDWSRWEQAHARDAKLVVIPGSGQQRATGSPWAGSGSGVPAGLEIELCANGCSTWATGCV
jgi:pimeloyl-ACP methyl ester carboxylesterase